jgi:D-tyrosyl-tRNA(Tyr) deacylase
MRIIAQRVKNASVKVDGKITGSINDGLLLLVGFTEGDDLEKINFMVRKVINLRVFDDTNGVMNLSVKDIGGSILSVSQFTLYGDATKGNRPSYAKALKGEESIKLYDLFNQKLKEEIHTETGIFGAEMEVNLLNDGPITIILEK